MNLKNLPRLSEVSLEHAKLIVQENSVGWFLTKHKDHSSLYHEYSDVWFDFYDDELSHTCHSSGKEIESYMGYLRAHKLGYYVPGISEEIQLQFLRGKLDACEDFKDLDLYSNNLYTQVKDWIEQLEKEIEELKQTES